MPDSKLVEKLGFEIREIDGIHRLIFADRPKQKYAVHDQEVALWNLCLELSERLETFEADEEKEYARLNNELTAAAYRSHRRRLNRCQAANGVEVTQEEKNLAQEPNGNTK